MQSKTFEKLNSPLANQIVANGELLSYFGGTAYLGIPQHAEFINLYLKGINKFGLNNGTSRSNNVQLGIYGETEDFSAQKFGAESAIITSSGYLAAQLTVRNLCSLGEIRYAPATHPALWLDENPGCNSSFEDWTRSLVAEINESSVSNWIVISNAMNNLYPEIYDFSFVKNINKKVLLIIDDSHGIGLNNEGKSALDAVPKCKNIEVVVVASMAKALGIDAGLILGSSAIIDQLRKSNEYLGASPPSAAGLFAFMQASAIYDKERFRLLELIKNLGDFLTEKDDWHFIPEFPVFFSKNADLSARLSKAGILVSSFPYPSKNDPIVDRIVLCSWHTDEDLRQLKTYL